jgi:predicted N-acyltransferase
MTPSLSVHRTICEIDVHEWNDLAGDSAFALHGWLLTVERSWREAVDPLYFTLTLDGRLIAGSVCYLADANSRNETLDDMLFGRMTGIARAVGMSFLPSLVCGPALGYGWHIGVHAALSECEADRARSHVLDAIEMEARAREMQVSFALVLDSEPGLKRLLTERGYLRCRNVPVNVLDLTWQSPTAFMYGLPRKRRTEFQRQIKRNRDAGCVIETTGNPAAVEARLLQLLDWNAQKHSGRPFPAGDGFFRELSRNLGANALVFTARLDESLTGVHVVLLGKEAAFAAAVGVDPQTAVRDYTYFVIAYHSPISMALERGLSRFYFGRGMYEIKRRRGCRLTDSWTYAKVPGPRWIVSAAWFALATQWNRYKLPSGARRSLSDPVARRDA